MVLHDSNGHQVVAVKAERVSNGGMVVHLRCCGNPETDHPHTMYALDVVDTATITTKLQEVAAQVAAQHKSMDAAHEFITKMIEPAKPHKTTMVILD